MAKDFDDFVALYLSDDGNERINALVAEFEKDDKDDDFTLFKKTERRCLGILREYHRWITG